jgi:hypothetical protein
MNERSISGEVLLTPVEWVDENLEFIVRCMEEQRLRLAKYYYPTPPLINPDKRSLSEMPLCEAWRRIAKDAGLPIGFSISWTEVFVGRDGESFLERGHFMAIRNDSEIVCITPGQFVKRDEKSLAPGERVRIMADTAPELMKIFPGGLAIIHGNKNDIGTRLGIWY